MRHPDPAEIEIPADHSVYETIRRLHAELAEKIDECQGLHRAARALLDAHDAYIAIDAMRGGPMLRADRKDRQAAVIAATASALEAMLNRRDRTTEGVDER